MKSLSVSRLFAFSTLMIVLLLLYPIKTVDAKQSNDHWNYVDDYAPIITFNNYIEYYPTRFPSDTLGSGYFTYVNIKPPDSLENGYRFQYWFYYAKDIRINEEMDSHIMKYWSSIKYYTGFHELGLYLDEQYVSKLFHKHDWECVEVFVTKLGDKPKNIRYCAHGEVYPQYPNAQNLVGNHCKVRVISDMHGCYPPYPWLPIGNWINPGILAEFAIDYSHNPDIKTENKNTTTIDFSNKWRRFTPAMRSYDESAFKNYPYKMPWERGYYYID